MEYETPFSGGPSIERQTVETNSGASVPSDSWAADFSVTSTGSTLADYAERSPIDARIAASNWSREDVELAFRMASVAATIGALYLTYRGGR